jgi:hypothetical protein
VLDKSAQFSSRVSVSQEYFILRKFSLFWCGLASREELLELRYRNRTLLPVLTHNPVRLDLNPYEKVGRTARPSPEESVPGWTAYSERKKPYQSTPYNPFAPDSYRPNCQHNTTERSNRTATDNYSGPTHSVHRGYRGESRGRGLSHGRGRNRGSRPSRSLFDRINL